MQGYLDGAHSEAQPWSHIHRSWQYGCLAFSPPRLPASNHGGFLTPLPPRSSAPKSITSGLEILQVSSTCGPPLEQASVVRVCPPGIPGRVHRPQECIQHQASQRLCCNPSNYRGYHLHFPHSTLHACRRCTASSSITTTEPKARYSPRQAIPNRIDSTPRTSQCDPLRAPCNIE